LPNECFGYLTWVVWRFLEHQQQQKAGASGDVQELGPDGKSITKRNFSMDAALEDKICELYDIFIDVRFLATNTYCEICVLCSKPY
jgi:hypothetical protein